MADLEALSAPNRSIWQPISYMNPIDTYVGNKGKLSALKATDLEFQKADEKLAIDDALQNSAKSLEHDNPAMQQYLAQHRNRIDNIAETIKDPYELNRQIKKASTQFANELSDPNSFLGSAGIVLKNYYENLKEAKTPDEKLLVEDNKANYQGLKLDPNTKSYQESILKKIEFAPNIDPLDEQNKGVQLYKEDAYKTGSTTYSPDKSFLVHTEKGNRYISQPEARSYFEKTLNTNSDLQLKLKQQAEINTIKQLGLGARTKNPDEFKQVYDNNRNKLYSDWINSSIDKLAHDDKSNNETWQTNPYELENTRKKNAASLLEPPTQEKQTFFGGNYKNKYTKYSSENNEKQGNFINYNNQKLIPADAAKEAVKNGLIKDSEYETAKTILNYNANPSLFNTTLSEIFNDSESPVKANERALLTVKLEKAGLLNVIKNENADLSSNQFNWIKGVLMNGLDTPNTITNELLKRTKSGNTREEKIASDEFNNYLDNYISRKDVKEKYLKKYNDYHKNLESIVSNGSEDDVYYQKQTETKDTPTIFESGDVTFDEGLGGKKRKDFSSVASWFENSDIPENADITYKRVATNRNINTGGSEWQVIVRDKPNGTILKSGFAQVAPSPEVKEIMQPITKLWEQVYSGDSQPTYYKLVKDNNNNSKILPISEKEFKNTPDNLKPAVFKLSTTDVDGNPIKGGILKSGNGNVSTLDNFANKYASHNVNKFSELGISRFWNPDREKQKVNSATQYYNNKQQEEVNPEDIQR